MKNKNHPSETLPIDNHCQTGLPLFSGGVFIMKEIQLTKGQVVLVDDEDFEYLNQYKWYADKGSSTFYAKRDVWVNRKRTRILMHCEILNGKGIDHIDHNGLNNQKNNLRFCTNSENSMNRRKQENCTSVYKGVYFSNPAKKWRADIMFNYKHIFLGHFVSEVEAAKAYNAKAKELFREFANLNNLTNSN